jgi:hypothetical protein
MIPPEAWERPYAETLASMYAGEQSALLATSKAQEQLKEALRRWMDINNCDELIEGETGMGVELGAPPSTTTWDCRSMPDELVLSLARRGVLTVTTGAFDALRKAGGGTDLDDAQRFRMQGEGTRPLKIAVRA